MFYNDSRKNEKLAKLAEKLNKEAHLLHLNVNDAGINLLWDWKIPAKYEAGKQLYFAGQYLPIKLSKNVAGYEKTPAVASY